MQELANHQRPVMIIDDDQVDIISCRRGASAVGLVNPLIDFSSGIKALKYLEDNPADLPCLIILDLNMPEMTGQEFLVHLRGVPELSHLPVWVMSTSSAPKDIYDAYKQHVAGYLLKSVSGKDFSKDLALIKHYIDTVAFVSEERH